MPVSQSGNCIGLKSVKGKEEQSEPTNLANSNMSHEQVKM